MSDDADEAFEAVIQEIEKEHDAVKAALKERVDAAKERAAAALK